MNQRAKKGTEIYSIFCQIERVAAEIMIERHGLYRIEPQDIPPTAAVNDAGQHASFAVVMPREYIGEFNKLCADLRA